MNANPGLNPNSIYVGQKLIIPTTITYAVLSGDTLYKIAIKYGITIADIINANPGLNPNLIYIGQKLIIPQKNRSYNRIIHTLAPWDSLWNLSQFYNVPIIDIVRNNYLTPTSILYIGQKIIIR
jgi:LysM repeat protein